MPKLPNLLRRHQVEALKGELARMDRVLANPFLASTIQDKNEFHRQRNAHKKMLDEQSPQPLEKAEKDKAAARAKELKDQLLLGMPTQAEMRRNPPGVVNKHIQWEKANKGKLLEWKYLTRRLEPDSDDSDLTNFEKFRPRGGSQELPMDGAQIPGKLMFIPPTNPEPGSVATDEELQVLRETAPELADAMAILPGEQRATILAAVRKAIDRAKPASDHRERAKKVVWTPERRNAAAARLKAGREAKAAARANVEPVMAEPVMAAV